MWETRRKGHDTPVILLAVTEMEWSGVEWIKAQIHSIQQIAGGAPGAPGRDYTINSIYI